MDSEIAELESNLNAFLCSIRGTTLTLQEADRIKDVITDFMCSLSPQLAEAHN